MDTARGAPGRELKGHENRSATTIHGWPSVLFGLVATGAGIPALLAALGYLPPDAANAPRFILVVVGGIFALMGLSLVAHGLSGTRRETRVRRGRERYPREPWRWDYPWDERGARDDSLRQLSLWAWRVVGFGVFCVPSNWLAFSGEAPWWILVGFGLGNCFLNLLVLYLAYRFLYALVQLVVYGSGGLRYSRFPFFLGETLDVRIEPTKRMEEMRELTATLRGVEERYEDRGSGEDRTPAVIVYEVYSETKNVKVPTGSVGRTLGAGLSFVLPEASLVPPTSLGERPPIYWELEVEAPGTNYEATFLVPVYSRHSVRGGGITEPWAEQRGG